ncbi:MAG TPA: ATP-binding protein [Opitutaceae bacterium]
MQSLIADANTPELRERAFTPIAPPTVEPALLEQPELLRSLVAHRCALDASVHVEPAIVAMKRAGVEFAAVLEGGRLLGQVGRHHLDEMLGGRFGFALNGRAEIRRFVAAPSLAVGEGDAIADVLAGMNRRAGSAFYDDVMLVDAGRQFLGFIATRTLVQVQHELFVRQIGSLAASTESLNRLNGQLTETYKGLVDASRLAGRAEIATGVLHNVGNVLNSLNVSASVVATGLRQSKCEAMVKAVAMLRERGADLAEFLAADPKGRRLPELLEGLARHSVTERERLLGEVESLQQSVDHIKEIVAMQQAYATMVAVVEPLDAATLMEDALRLNAGAFERYGVSVVREFGGGGRVLAEKAKILQILLNLIRNAKHACDDSAPGSKCITLRIARVGERLRLIVADNGVGIPAENLTRIFGHGFTTRAGGHGFGLHSSANAAREMSGSLTAHSEGRGCGATFTLELPAAVE